MQIKFAAKKHAEADVFRAREPITWYLVSVIKRADRINVTSLLNLKLVLIVPLVGRERTNSQQAYKRQIL